jgi:phage terminase large subunit-like protein
MEMNVKRNTRVLFVSLLMGIRYLFLHTKTNNVLDMYREMSKACNEWEQILVEHPTDLQAVKFSHDAYFFSGKREQKLVTIDSVLNKWTPNLPCARLIFTLFYFIILNMIIGSV